MALKTIARPSPNYDARPAEARIDMLVMHYTGMKTAEEALARLCDAEARVSSHYTIDCDGTVYVHVPEAWRAWHAGVSFWAGEYNVNASSIGIEIVNPGHEFGYEIFPDAQIAAVIDLSREIMARHGIAPARVLGHSDVAPARKQDPGELFPWPQLAEFGVGIWPFPNVASARPVTARDERPAAQRGTGVDCVEMEQTFVHNLGQFGYGVPPTVDVPLEKLVQAFQRHWRPSKIDGIIDEESAYRLGVLLGALS